MKKLFLTLLLSLACNSNVFATAQFPDLLIYNNETVGIFSNPLESYFDNAHPRPNQLFQTSCTANWRGYLATWTITNGTLYLVKLVDGSCMENPAEISLSEIFPNQKTPIAATWFSGVLRVPQGKQLEYVHMGYGSVYEKELQLTIKDGKLIDEKLIDNSKKPVPSVEDLTDEELRKLQEWENRVK